MRAFSELLREPGSLDKSQKIPVFQAERTLYEDEKRVKTGVTYFKRYLKPKR